MNPSFRGAPVALQGARSEKGWCRANAINFPPEVIVLKRANTPSLAGYWVSVTAIQLCDWSAKAPVDHRDRRVRMVPPDTFVDDQVNITAFLVPTRVFFWLVGNYLKI